MFANTKAFSGLNAGSTNASHHAAARAGRPSRGGTGDLSPRQKGVNRSLKKGG